MDNNSRINNLPITHAEAVNEDYESLEHVEGMPVTIYAWPSSQCCMGCVHGISIARDQRPFCNNHYICLIGSCNNHNSQCIDRR